MHAHNLSLDLLIDTYANLVMIARIIVNERELKNCCFMKPFFRWLHFITRKRFFDRITQRRRAIKNAQVYQQYVTETHAHLTYMHVLC